jgi:transposase
MTQGQEPMRQPMRTRAGLEGDVEALIGVLLAEGDQPGSRELPAKHHIAGLAKPDHMKAVLADVDTDLFNLHDVSPLLAAELSADGRRRTIPQDEARIGQKNGRTRIWARKGSRPRLPADQRYANAYLFGAICPKRGVAAGLVLPHVNTHAMQLHLDQISRHVARKAHAVVLMDRAGWHISGELKVPHNLTIILLPSRSPELNPVENVWQYLRQNWLSNRVFETYDAILDAACEAWNNLLDQPDKITSIGWRSWACNGH